MTEGMKGKDEYVYSFIIKHNAMERRKKDESNNACEVKYTFHKTH